MKVAENVYYYFILMHQENSKNWCDAQLNFQLWLLPDSSNPNPLCIVKMMKAEMMIHIASASGDSPPVKGLFIAVLDSPPVKGLFVVMLPLTDIMRYIK